MDLLLIIGLILWVSSSVKKRKEEQKRREAAQARARAAAFAEDAEQTQERFPESPSSPQIPQAPQPTADPSRPKPRLTTPLQRRHPLSSSRETGHAHMETSMTGINDVCPPVSAPAAAHPTMPTADRSASGNARPPSARPAAASAAPQATAPVETADSAFRYDPARIREGLIYAEILGKPKALRR